MRPPINARMIFSVIEKNVTSILISSFAEKEKANNAAFAGYLPMSVCKRTIYPINWLKFMSFFALQSSNCCGFDRKFPVS